MKRNMLLLLIIFALTVSACGTKKSEFVPPLQVEGSVIVEETTRANGYKYVWEVVYKVDSAGEIFLIEQQSEPGHSWLVSHGRACKKSETPAAAVKCMNAAGVVVWTEQGLDGEVKVFHKP